MKYPALIAVAFALLTVTGCSENSSTGPGAGVQNAAAEFDAMIAQVNAMPAGTISTATSDGLAHMREEEKLARDVYMHLAATHGAPVFSNIVQSEARHMNAMKLLLDRYGIADPVTSDVEGAFTDPHFTDLYKALTTRGDKSLLDAFTVGATIEDLDIKDLKDLMASPVAQDVLLVYGNLERASENHLRAFVTNLASNGGSYTPQYISQAEYDAILSGSNGRGHGRHR